MNLSHAIELIDPVFDDDGFVVDMVRANAPYWTTMRYVVPAAAGPAGGAEAGGTTRPPGSPWFRGDWAYNGQPLVAGAERVLAHHGFAEAAKATMTADPAAAVVRPAIVYVNLNTEGTVPDPGHVDVPLYRGIDRNEHGVGLCHLLRSSRLFERWRLPIATAVSWFSEQEGGAFVYWPDGPDRAPQRHGPPFRNTALVSDNDSMFHCVDPVGTGTTPAGLTVDALLAPNPARSSADGDRWSITDNGSVIASYPFSAVRISVSWKALVFADTEAESVRDNHSDDLTLEHIVGVLNTDLRERGEPPVPDGLSLTDSATMDRLQRIYPRHKPTVAK